MTDTKKQGDVARKLQEDKLLTWMYLHRPRLAKKVEDIIARGSSGSGTPDHELYEILMLGHDAGEAIALYAPLTERRRSVADPLKPRGRN